MPRPRPRQVLSVTLTGGPCHGQKYTIGRKLWDYGTLMVAGQLEEPWQAAEDMPLYGPLPPVYAYRRTLMGHRTPGATKARYWYEWHYERSTRA